MPEETKTTNEAQMIQLAPGSLQYFEQSSLRHDAEIPQGVDPKELLNPPFWAHHAAKLQPWHEIRARAADGTWCANLVVLDVSRTWARVHLLSFHRLTDGQVAESQASEQEVKNYVGQHKVTHRGAAKWSILRKDGAIVEEGIVDKAEAEKRLEALARKHVGGAAAQRQAITA